MSEAPWLETDSPIRMYEERKKKQLNKLKKE
jgi:hypothetical protein